MIDTLCKYFSSCGFRAFPHVRLNIAWSTSLSDVDVILIKDNMVTVIEVKSSKDKFSKAEKQLNALSDFADYLYVATDKLQKSNPREGIGLIQIDKDKVTIEKLATQITKAPKLESLMALPKKCLVNLLGNPQQRGELKYDLSYRIKKTFNQEFLRICVKEMGLCHECGISSCPALILPNE